jgi:regulatory protein
MTFSRRNPYQDLPQLSLSDAKKKIMDFVARRDHSEKELRKKLSLRCEPEIVDQAIEWAKEQNWLAQPEVLSEKFAEQLSRRGKGIRKINQKLKELGLGAVKADKETELEKAKRLVLNKWSAEDFRGLGFQESQKLKAKIMRYLIARGYESDIVSNILKNEFKAGAISHDEEY